VSSLILVPRIRATIDIVFAAIATPRGISYWWGLDAHPVLIAEMDARLGGYFRVRFRMLDGTEHQCTGEILEFVPPKRIIMTWQWLGRETEDKSRLEMSLQPIGAGTEMILRRGLYCRATRRQNNTPRAGTARSTNLNSIFS
jgi:uncharacterized protein YndB with AHSA1/START domain